MIRVENLSRNYGDVKALDRVSFSAEAGRITAFLGPNGAGKTTAFKIMSGFIYPDCGSVRLAGMDIAERPLDCKALIGYLPENNPLYEDMEVCEYLLWSGAVRGMRGRQLSSAVGRTVEQCGLGSVAGKAIGELSKGYRQRAGIAGAILHAPKILLLDEPTSGLDPNQASEMRTLIRGLSAEAAVLLSTHMLSEAQSLCDKMVLISRGKIAAEGTARELSARAPAFSLVLGPGAPEEVERELSALEGASAVSKTVSAEEIRFRVQGVPEKDLRRQVFELAVKNGWPVLELRKEADYLEALFKELA